MSNRPRALVTGASMGIGAAFADALAARNHDLVLTARSADALDSIAARLRARDGVRIETCIEDLEDAGAPERIVAFTNECFGGLDLLVNNAGFGAHGRYETIALERQLGQIRVNIDALVELTTRVVPAMLERGSGGIINVASTASFQPVPYMSVYAATKAFVLSYSDALAEEFRGRGVRVMALCPGATSTNFFKRAGEGAAAPGSFRTSEQVVQTALRAYNAGANVVVDGTGNKLLAFSHRIAPRSLMVRGAALIMKPRDDAPRGTASGKA